MTNWKYQYLMIAPYAHHTNGTAAALSAAIAPSGSPDNLNIVLTTDGNAPGENDAQICGVFPATDAVVAFLREMEQVFLAEIEIAEASAEVQALLANPDVVAMMQDLMWWRMDRVQATNPLIDTNQAGYDAGASIVPRDLWESLGYVRYLPTYEV